MSDPLNFAQTRFMQSGLARRDWVVDSGREVAFVGRSNVGKSSAINVITNQRALARTSKTPGRTQHLVFFEIKPEIRLVDLPGYGFAKTPVALRHAWQETIIEYLFDRQSLQGLVIPMDIRRPFTELDQQMMAWADDLQLPVHILLTKADKFSRGKAQSILLEVQRNWLGAYDASAQLFSAPKRQGIEQAREKLSSWLQMD